jgi:uncharacterized protein (DUF1330 family)
MRVVTPRVFARRVPDATHYLVACSGAVAQLAEHLVCKGCKSNAASLARLWVRLAAVMAAYVVITKTRTRNQSELDLYAKKAPVFMAGHSATYLARFGVCEVQRGSSDCRCSDHPLPDIRRCEGVVRSPAYQEASQHRFKGGDYDIVLVEGLAPSGAH